MKRHLLTLALALSAGSALAQTTPAGAGAPAPTQRTTVEQDNLWDIAGQLAPAFGASRQQVMVAVLRGNPDAFVKGNIHRLRKGVPLTLPGREAVLAEDRAGSVALVADHLKAMRSGAVLPPLTPRAASVAVPPPAPAPAPSAPTQPTSAPRPAVPASVLVEKPAPVDVRPVPASAAAPVVVEPAPVDSASDGASAAVDSGGGSTSRVLPWLLMLGGVAGGVILWRRRRAGFRPDAAASEFGHSLSATRTGGPRVFDISNAAAEMARSVETSLLVTQLVRSDAAVDADHETDTSRLAAQAAIKLEIARASLEVGRTDEARALLLAVMREGAGRHQAEAAEIHARMG